MLVWRSWYHLNLAAGVLFIPLALAVVYDVEPPPYWPHHQVTAEALQDRQAALMSNHGTVAIGETPEQAVDRTGLLEWAAGLYWRGALIGTPRVLSEDQQQELRATISRIGYGHIHPLDS